jgi:hypothetical protein
MDRLQRYGEWLEANLDKRDSEEWQGVAAAYRELRGQAAPPEPTPVEPKKKTGTVAAFSKGARLLGNDLRTVASMPFQGIDDAAVAGAERAQAIQSEYDTGASLDKVKDAYGEGGVGGFLSAAGEVVSQVPEFIAEQTPQLLAAAIPGGLAARGVAALGAGAVASGVTRAAVSTAPLFGQALSNNAQRQVEEDVAAGRGIDVNTMGAVAAAGAITALDRFGLGVALGKAGSKKVFGEKITDLLSQNKTAAAEKLAREMLAKESTKRVLATGALKTAGTESPTEVLQQMIERAQAGLDLFSDDALAEYKETAYAASLFAPVGSVGRLADRSAARGQVNAENAQQAQAAQAAATPATPSADPAVTPPTAASPPGAAPTFDPAAAIVPAGTGDEVKGKKAAAPALTPDALQADIDARRAKYLAAGLSKDEVDKTLAPDELKVREARRAPELDAFINARTALLDPKDRKARAKDLRKEFEQDLKDGRRDLVTGALKPVPAAGATQTAAPAQTEMMDGIPMGPAPTVRGESKVTGPVIMNGAQMVSNGLTPTPTPVAETPSAPEAPPVAKQLTNKELGAQLGIPPAQVMSKMKPFLEDGTVSYTKPPKPGKPGLWTVLKPEAFNVTEEKSEPADGVGDTRVGSDRVAEGTDSAGLGASAAADLSQEGQPATDVGTEMDGGGSAVTAAGGTGGVTPALTEDAAAPATEEAAPAPEPEAGSSRTLNDAVRAIEKIAADDSLETDRGDFNFVSTPGRELYANKLTKAVAGLLKGFDFSKINWAVESPNQSGKRAVPPGTLAKLTGNEKARGAYSADDNVVILTEEGAGDPLVVMHELIHAAIEQVLRRYRQDPNSVSLKQRTAIEQLRRLQSFVAPKLRDQFGAAFANQSEFIAYGMTNPLFQEALATVKLPPGEQRYGVGKLRTGWNAFTNAVTRILAGQKATRDTTLEGTALAELTEAVTRVMESPTQQSTPIKDLKDLPDARFMQAPPAGGPTYGSAEDIAQVAARETAKVVPNTATPMEQYKQFSWNRWYQNWKRKYQDYRAAALDLERLNTTTGVITDNEHAPVAAAQMATALSDQEYNKHAPKVLKLSEQIVALGKKLGMDEKQATGYVSTYLKAMHWLDARELVWRWNAPLSNRDIDRRGYMVPDRNGNMISMGDMVQGANSFTPMEARNLIVDRFQSDGSMTPAQAKYYWAMLGHLTDPNGPFIDQDFTDPKTRKKRSPDKNSSEYNPIGADPASAWAARRAAFERSAEIGDLREIQKTLKEVQEATKAMQREIGEWTSFTDNYANAYDFQNYVTFKGAPDANKTLESAEFFGGLRRSKLHAELFQPLNGRQTESENAVLQSMADMKSAAYRKGHYAVTERLANSVGDSAKDSKRWIKGSIQNVKFNERNEKLDYDALHKGRKILHYNKDGTVDIITIADPKIYSAFRPEYHTRGKGTDALATLTSWMGQTHTRYNPGFAPYNFVRDFLTYSFIMNVEFSGKEATSFAGKVAASVLDGRMGKAFRVARMHKDRLADLEREAAAPGASQFLKDSVEFIKRGGVTTYLDALTPARQFRNNIVKAGKQSYFRDSVKGLQNWLDIWAGTFEFTTRVSAFQVAKQHYMQKGVAEEVANERAAMYAKNLANFESVGEAGRTLSAFFMFWRPAATGATRNIDVLSHAAKSTDRFIEELPDDVKADPAKQQLAVDEHNRLRARAQGTMMAMLGAGAAAYVMASMMAGDDDEGRNKIATDNKDLWVRNMRLPNPFSDGDADFIQIPWGFGFGAFGSIGAQLTALANGDQHPVSAGVNVMNVVLDSYMPIPISQIGWGENGSVLSGKSMLQWLFDTITPSALRPGLEFLMNKNSLGSEVYTSRPSRYGNAYTGGLNTPEIYKQTAQMLMENTAGGMDISVQPNTLYFWANNFADGPMRLLNAALVTSSAAYGDSSLKDSMPLLSSFLGRTSSFDAREFGVMDGRVAKMDQNLKQYESHPELYLKYIESNPTAPYLKEFRDDKRAELNKVWKAINDVKASDDYTPAEKREIVKAMQQTRDFLMRQMNEVYKEFGVAPN